VLGALVRVRASLCTISTALSRTVCSSTMASSPMGRPSAAISTLTVNCEDTSEVEALDAAQLAEHLLGHGADGLFERQQIALHEGVLDQAAQAVVLRWVGAAQGGAGAARQLGHRLPLADE
jgi:hypothetical protein